MTAERRRNQIPPPDPSDESNISTSHWIHFLREIPAFNQETQDTFSVRRETGGSAIDQYAHRYGIGLNALKAKQDVPSGGEKLQIMIAFAERNHWIRIVKVPQGTKRSHFFFCLPAAIDALETLTSISQEERNTRVRKQEFFAQFDDDANLLED